MLWTNGSIRSFQALPSLSATELSRWGVVRVTEASNTEASNPNPDPPASAGGGGTWTGADPAAATGPLEQGSGDDPSHLLDATSYEALAALSSLPWRRVDVNISRGRWGLGSPHRGMQGSGWCGASGLPVVQYVAESLVSLSHRRAGSV